MALEPGLHKLAMLSNTLNRAAAQIVSLFLSC